MEIPFEKTRSRFWQQKLYTPVTLEACQEYKLPESMPDIGRVIAAWGQAVLRGKEWRGDHIGISGGVMVWVLYAPEDGSAPRRLESWIPFTARVDHSHDGEDGVIRAECVLCGADARNVSARKLMLRSSVGLMVQTLVPREAELCSPGEIPEDVQILERVYPMVLTREAGERSFLSDEQVPMPQGMPQPQKVIYCRLMPRITERRVMGSRAVFRGTGELHLLYQDDEEKLHSTDVSVPFAQYVDLEGDYTDDAEISCLSCITSLEAEPEETGGLRVKCGLVCQYIINAPTVVRCAEDAYSCQRELELQQQDVLLPAWLEEQIRQVELGERLAGDEVPVDAIFFPDLPLVTKQPGGVEVRCGGSFQTLTEAPDGTLQSKSLKAAKAETLMTACDTIPCTWLRGGTALRREGSGWTLEQELELKLDSLCTKPVAMLAGIRAGQLREPDPDRPSVIVRARKPEESLWDIAKYCGSTVSAIQRLNRLESEPEENRLLLIPVI